MTREEGGSALDGTLGAINQCLEKDPHRRPTARELGRLLEALSGR